MWNYLHFQWHNFWLRPTICRSFLLFSLFLVTIFKITSHKNCIKRQNYVALCTVYHDNVFVFTVNIWELFVNNLIIGKFSSFELCYSFWGYAMQPEKKTHLKLTLRSSKSRLKIVKSDLAWNVKQLVTRIIIGHYAFSYRHYWHTWDHYCFSIVVDAITVSISHES